MKAVIMAGGKGERLKPLTDNIPKPMVLVQGKPVLLHIIEYLKKYGFDDFIITLCYKAEAVKDYFGDGSKFGINIDYTLEDEANPLGTAGGVGLARKKLNETFLLTCGDALRSFDPNKLIELHKTKKGIGVMAIHKPGAEIITSLVKFDNNWKLLGFVERPNQEQLEKAKEVYMNSSLFILEPDIFKYIPENQKVDFGFDVWPKVLENYENLYVYPTDDFVLDVGTHEKLEAAERLFEYK